MNQTLGSLVAAQPHLGPVFEGLGFDYCCGGHRTLDQACRDRGLDPDTLARVLAALPKAGPAPSAENPAQLPLPRLIDHIVAVHHGFVRRELPRLTGLAAKVARAHGPQHPEVVELEACLGRLAQALGPHLEAEETQLFPLLLSGAGPSALAPYFAEHEEAGALVARARDLTGGFDRPGWACATYRALMDGLAAFEADLHQHVHLENNVLFLGAPR